MSLPLQVVKDNEQSAVGFIISIVNNANLFSYSVVACGGKKKRFNAFCLYPFYCYLAHLEPQYPVDVYTHLDLERKLIGVNKYTRFAVCE